MGKYEVCDLDDIQDGDSAKFVPEVPESTLAVLIVRKNDKLFGYINSCPHIGAPLDIRPGKFLSSDKKHILCSNHGALFEINTGYCVFGPCQGKYLEPVETMIEGKSVIIKFQGIA